MLIAATAGVRGRGSGLSPHSTSKGVEHLGKTQQKERKMRLSKIRELAPSRLCKEYGEKGTQEMELFL